MKKEMIKLTDLLNTNPRTRRNRISEGKKKAAPKKMTVDTKIKEIEQRGSVAALEAKMSALDEEIDVREGKLTVVRENEGISEFVSQTKIKEMQKDIKMFERAKGKYSKQYERMTGKQYIKPQIVNDEMGQETRR